MELYAARAASAAPKSVSPAKALPVAPTTTRFPLYVELKQAQPIARGTIRALYAHPERDDLAIKVMVADRRFERWHVKFGGIAVSRRYGVYTDFYREIREYLAVRSRQGKAPPLFQPVHGLIETDLGLGMVVSKMRGPDGALAPPLAKMVRSQGLTPQVRQMLDRLLAELNDHDVATGDINAGGILWVADPPGGVQLVVVDGLGDKSFIPVNSMSRTINRWSNWRHMRRVLRMLEWVDRENALKLNK
jgi:hypothetical protein